VGRPPLCLGHLTALEELTVHGRDCGQLTRDFFDQLGQPGVEPALPASLKVLRLGGPAWGIHPFSWGDPPYNPTWPKAPAFITIPVLELHGHGMLLLFDGSSTSQGERANSCCLPPGFESLRICTERISLHTTGTPNVVWRPKDTPPAEELCRFCEVAPQCYKEIRICAPPGGLPMAAPAIRLQSHDGLEHGSTGTFGTLDSLAEAMAQCPEAGTLAISVLQDEQCLRITRSGTTS